MKKTIRSLSTYALLTFVLAPLAACASPVGEDGVRTSESALTIARPGDLKPGIGASACTSDTCISGPSNDCSGFDDTCKSESGCGVTINGNPLAQVHTCVTIPPPPPSESTRPARLTSKEVPQEEECFDGDACNDLIAACVEGDHIWVCHTYGDLGVCVHGDCVGAP